SHHFRLSRSDWQPGSPCWNPFISRRGARPTASCSSSGSKSSVWLSDSALSPGSSWHSSSAPIGANWPACPDQFRALARLRDLHRFCVGGDVLRRASVRPSEGCPLVLSVFDRDGHSE